MLSKKILKFALPMIVSNLIIALNGFAMMWILSQLGSTGVAAGALVYNTFAVMASLVFAFSVPVSIFAARAYGGGQLQEMPRILQAGCLVVIGLGIVVAIGVSNLMPMFNFFHQPHAPSLIAAGFFKGYAFALVPFGLRLVLAQIINGTSKPKISSLFSLITLLLTIPICYWFATGGLGLHAMGAYGVGVGAAISNTLVLAITACYLHFSKFYRSMRLFRVRAEALWGWIKNTFSMGIPVSAQRVGEVTAMFAITVLIGHLGQMQLASYQIALQFSFVVVMIGFGFTQASGILVGQALGAGKTKHATEQGTTAIRIAFFIALACSLVFVLFPHMLVHVFVRGHSQHVKKITDLAVSLLAIVAISQVFDTIRNVATGALRGYKDTRYPMWLGFFSCWVIAVPAGYFLANHLHMGARGAVIGFAAGVTIGTGLVILRLKKLQKLSHVNEGVQAIDRQ
jgi:multidrug resistance protein, MATE family